MVTSRSIGSAASALLVALLLIFAPRPAAADRKVVVLTFSGPKAAQFEKLVVKIVKGVGEYISAKRYERAASKVKGFEPGDAESAAKVLKKLGASGLIGGAILKKGKNLTVVVRLRGPDGEFLGDPIKLTAKGGKLGANEKKLKAQLTDLLEQLPEDGEEVVAADEPAAEEEEAPADEESGEAEEAPPKKKVARADPTDEEGAGAGDEETAGGGESAGEESAAGDTASKGGDGETAEAVAATAGEQDDLAVRGRGVELGVGMSFVKRSLSFALSKEVADSPQAYRGGFVPGIFVAGEVYPMAITGRGRKLIKNIGLSLDFERVLKIESKLEQMSDVVLPTTYQRFAIGALYRWNLGSKPTSPTVKFGVAYNKSSFKIDRSEAPEGAVEIPSVNYTYISPGAEFRYPLTGKIGLEASAYYLVVTKAGEIAQASSFGAGSTSGLEFDAAATYTVTGKISAKLGLRYAQIGMQFQGNGALADRDNDQMADVTSATDRYVGLNMLVGYVF